MDLFVTSLSGVRMPRILYGTAWKKERTAALVEQALTLGFRGIDTACQPKHYHEPGVGEGVQAVQDKGLSRQEIYLQSKFTPFGGQDPMRIPYDPKASLAQQVVQSCQTSLKNLQTDYLDGLILHSPLAHAEEMQEVWQAMEGLHAKGVVRQLGISNCYSLPLFTQLFHAAKVKPAVLQNRFYAETRYDRELRQFCHQQHIIYQSFWTLTANPRILRHPLVQLLARKYQCSTPQIFFRYISQIGIMPLTGTTSATHMQEDLAIFEYELTPDECLEVEAQLLTHETIP
ncbi:MAG: aldo/keto reductase [Nitrospirae bacterium]|nr:aldo/keto reductase [Magnetococcales bacterium]HAT51181.1 aldo/keto reductase [Alphaproteobacteria bacterium]